MDLLKHDIPTEFPHLTDKIHEMKTSNGHFAKLYTRYDETNHEIRKSEMGGNPMADEALEAMKKLRLKLKDEIVNMLS
ncbi:MAG: DUF465 domain-containing protein [Burkholderiaceae bacterium]|nr:DUF465 domain-containing protein [Burkholderiaceae bacterium]